MFFPPRSTGRSLGLLLATTLAVVTIDPASAAGQSPRGIIRGAAMDGSGGMLPGVTIVASAAGRILGATATDDEGRFRLEPESTGPLDLTFQLDGFATSVVRVMVEAASESVVVERLELAPRAETVIVHGHLPPPPPPPVVLTPVPTHDRESVCGPARAPAVPERLGTVRSHRDKAQGLYAAGDEVVIDGGAHTGLQIGQNVVVRRHYRVRGAEGIAIGEHTSGLLQMVTVGEDRAIALVVYACDEIIQGDFVAPFAAEPIREPDPAGVPAFDEAAVILFGDEGQMIGVPRRLMVIGRGTEAGIRAGQRLTLFRDERGKNGPPSIIGAAIVIAARTGSATIRVQQANDAILFGDRAAPERAPVTPAR